MAINKVRQQLVKMNLKAGKSARQALKDAGYKNSTAHKSTYNKVVKVSMDEINKEFKASELKAEDILNNLNYIKELAINKGDLATATRCEELKGKYLAMFTDKAQVTSDTTITEKDKDLFNRIFE